MISKLWEKFESLGFSGSVATNIGKIEILGSASELHSRIYNALFELDPDYTQACIIEAGFSRNLGENTNKLLELDLAGRTAQQLGEVLDNAVLEGLGHQKAFKIKDSGELVKFGYAGDELF